MWDFVFSLWFMSTEVEQFHVLTLFQNTVSFVNSLLFTGPLLFVVPFIIVCLVSCVQWHL